MQEIPKVIHYCWFGGNPIPDSYAAYMKTWQTFFPDYEIRRWDESNFDVSCCDYVKEAYNAGKYAFVSDYARTKIIYDNGGLYFDTDVEVIRSLDDILSNGSFMGIEFMDTPKMIPGKTLGINTGLGFGAIPKLSILREVLDYYEALHFLNEDGSFNRTTVVEHVTGIFMKHGFVCKDEKQTVESITVYPSEYFDPIDCGTGAVRMTENTVTVHHYSATWASGKDKLKNIAKRVLGPKLTKAIMRLK